MRNTMQKWQSVIKMVVLNLDWFIAIVLSVIFSILGLIGWFPPNVIFATTLLVLSILSVSALRDRFTLEHREKAVSELVKISSTNLQSNQLLSDIVHTGLSRVFPHAVDFNWLPYIHKAKQVTVVSIKHLRFLWTGGYIEALEALLKRGGTVTLVMADPRSPALWLRFQEERTPFRSRAGDAEDLARFSIKLSEWRQHLIQEGLDTSRLSLKVFQNYPTQAFYKFDDSIFIYNYHYREAGYDAPMFLFTDPTTSVHEFLNRCIKSLITNSLPLEDVINDIQVKYDTRHFSDQHVLQSEIVADSKSTKKKNK
jgi:hypothetical protein